MIDLDFRTIRNHDGSQDNGFEELVCQLAHLEKPSNADYFFRKDGGGGDAGVECFWKLQDASEYGWQAKYFLDPLSTNQWGQINESVETALEKHPKLTKYYVCIPRDLNDSRKRGKGGKVVKSSLDIWNEHVERWSALASSKGMQVEFILWGKHEISIQLQRNQPKYAGRSIYWFGTPILTKNDFETLARRSEQSLGERYTPGFHVDLPIVEVFKALGEPKYWQTVVSKKISKWIKGFSEKLDSIRREVPQNRLNEVNFVDDYVSLKLGLLHNLQEGFTKINISPYLDKLNALDSKIMDYFELINEHRMPIKELDISINEYVVDLQKTNIELINFFTSRDFKASLKNALLLAGEAGIGKSHLLCDITLSRLANNLPTVFMLGQHYEGGDPVTSLKKSMDLSDISDDMFLGALDASGEGAKGKALIIIDAINEGRNREDWSNYLVALITKISEFPNINIVLSCRSTYLDWLIPEGLIDSGLMKITHQGFKGFEHKASAIYLSKQGISKPSAPILSPEFSNPLFLKICCKAIKDQGLGSFPKGLKGITDLLNFYINNIERTACKVKKYRRGERIVNKTFNALALKLYPDHQFGLELSEAITLINGMDSRPDSNNTLFDLLLHEGVISEDMIFNEVSQKADIPVIRFTYERFSDYFIANSLLNSVSKVDLKQGFSESGIFAPTLDPKSYFAYAGILNALATIIPEKYGLEMVNILPTDSMVVHSVLDNVFIDTVLWRSPQSFTHRTLEAFNKIPNYGYESIQLDTLLALSTEPDHPWNAELIHRNLINKSLPERDRFWSTFVAIADNKNDDSGEESNLRALIEWAYSGSLIDVDEERIRLCAVILIWMTSTSNRVIRDQATKSAVRLLSVYPKLIVGLFDKFKEVDDLYVIERLYAIAYGAITNSSDLQYLREVAQWIWENEFENGQPTPHLLLRDYARGIMEFALHKDQIDTNINPEIFRPPYTSSWPLNIPTKRELDEYLGQGFSRIKSSVLSGDFNKYTMSDVHKWSPTPIDEGEPQNVYQLQVQFAEKIEDPTLKEKLLSHLDEKKTKDEMPSVFDLEDFQKNLKEQGTTDNELTELDRLKIEIKESLSNEDFEVFRWVMGLGRSEQIGTFSRKSAQRWVCKRAFELGWTAELFDNFERNYLGYNGRMENKVERIGKKYQWIALYEFLAHLADNCLYTGAGYADVDDSQYYGPWQLYKRDIDPTFIPRQTNRHTWNEEETTSWWQPNNFRLEGGSLDELQDWLWSENNLPDFKNLLEVTDSSKIQWLVLKNETHQRRDPLEDNDTIPYQDVWYRINSCIVKKTDVEKFREMMGNRLLCGPSILEHNSSHQSFFREYPWHCVYNDFNNWKATIDDEFTSNLKYLMPISEYEWEMGGREQSLSDSISIYAPAKEIITRLSLSPDLEQYGHWINDNKELVFFDPSMNEKGSPSALIQTNILFDWLEENDLQLIWLVGGEKQLFTSMASNFFGRLIFSGIFTLTENGIEENYLWFNREDSGLQ